MNRRGFLQGLFAAVAVVAIEVKLQSAAPAAQATPWTWSEANDRYDYGINKNDPLDIVVRDKVNDEFIGARELMDRWHNAPNPNDYGDEFDDAYEATAIIAMSQGSLLSRMGERMVAVPEYAFDVIEARKRDDLSIDFDALPWIATATA